MSTDPPLPTDHHIEPPQYLSSFQQRLLQAGERSPEHLDGGIEFFKLVEQLYPIEATVFARAIGELMRRLEAAGATDEQVIAAKGQGRRLLGLTLVPFVERYLVDHFDAETQPADSEAVEIVRDLARPWAMAQLKRCVTYVVGLAINDYASHLREGAVTEAEHARMQELTHLIDELGHRPEANAVVDRYRRELQLLSDTLAAEPPLDPLNARVLSYLLSCTKEGQLRDIALAALVLRGNSSIGTEVTSNPMQVLDVADVATVLGSTRKSVTSNVSKLRNKATKWVQVDNAPYELDPRHLWVYVEPAESSRRRSDAVKKGE